MMNRSPTPETSLPGTLLLRTAGACDLDPARLLEVFGAQRRRFAAVLQGFGPDDWAAPTRCAARSCARLSCRRRMPPPGRNSPTRSVPLSDSASPGTRRRAKWYSLMSCR